MNDYVDVPEHLTRQDLVQEFSHEAANYYLLRVKNAQLNGQDIRYPVKQAYIWASRDRKNNTRFFKKA